MRIHVGSLFEWLIDMAQAVVRPTLGRGGQREPAEPTVEREWEKFSWCWTCEGLWLHQFIRWQPDDRVTKTCNSCGGEFEVAA